MRYLQQLTGMLDGPWEERAKYLWRRLREKDEKTLDSRLVNVFCQIFGEKYQHVVNWETTMDDVEEWDSLSFLDLVMAIEKEYQVEFTSDESAQMFQLGHIQRVLDQVLLDIPHDDVAHACSMAYIIKNELPDEFKLVVLSASSTREALLPVKKAEAILRQSTEKTCGWYNVSVSGLVLAEALQLLETIGEGWKGVVVIGISPIIMGGCGKAEFIRAASHQRFPFSAPLMEDILQKNAYVSDSTDQPIMMPAELWAKRYFKDLAWQEVKYKPYLYPTLLPWSDKKFASQDDFLRFYNHSVLNYEESFAINIEILKEIQHFTATRNLPILLLELPLHSQTLKHLDNIGNIVIKYKAFIQSFVKRANIPLLDISTMVGISDSDFRDSGHIYRKKDIFTQKLIETVMSLVPALEG